MQAVSTENSVLVGCVGSVAWVQVNGVANHENAGCIKQFLQGRFEQGWQKFVVDLEHCRGIDSTFIGMLYRLAKQVQRADQGGSVEVINPGERNQKSICKLGLDCLIKIDRDGSRWQREQVLVDENIAQPLRCEVLSRREHTQMVLDAHEALAEADAANATKFKDVLEFLRQELNVPGAEQGREG